MTKELEQPSVEEFFDSLGHGHPSVISSDKFNKLIAVYEMSWGNLPTMFDETEGECVKYCPVTGEELRRTKAYSNDFITKDISQIDLLDQIEELKSMNTFKTLVTDNANELLATLPRAQSECLMTLITNLVHFNQGHVHTEKAKRFKSAVKNLEEMGIVTKVHNGIKKHEHYSYRLAPYIAYKGSESMQEAAIQHWTLLRARTVAKSIPTKSGQDFPKESPLSNFLENISKETQ